MTGILWYVGPATTEQAIEQAAARYLVKFRRTPRLVQVALGEAPAIAGQMRVEERRVIQPGYILVGEEDPGRIAPRSPGDTR